MMGENKNSVLLHFILVTNIQLNQTNHHLKRQPRCPVFNSIFISLRVLLAVNTLGYDPIFNSYFLLNAEVPIFITLRTAHLTSTSPLYTTTNDDYSPGSADGEDSPDQWAAASSPPQA